MQKNIRKLIFKIIILLIPFFFLLGINTAYKQTNYDHYGIYAITDRSGSNYKYMINDLLTIEDPNVGTTWITKNMLDKAYSASPTLKSIEPLLNEQIYAWYGDEETTGDIIIWIIREAVDKAGIYAQGGEAVDDYYGRIHAELQSAFKSGLLEKNTSRLYLSSVSRGYTISEFGDYFKARIPEVLKTLIIYDQNMTTLNPARGTYENIAVMAQLTNSSFVWKDTESYLDTLSEKIVKIDKGIVKIYQATGKIIFPISLVGILLYFAFFLKKAFCKELDERTICLSLIMFGLICTCILLIVGVMWFCNFLSIKKVYDYLCAAVPLINTIEAVGIYILIDFFTKHIKKAY